MKLELLIKIMRISDKSIYIKFLTQKHKGGSVQCEMTKKTPSQNQQIGGEGQDWGPRCCLGADPGGCGPAPGKQADSGSW